jgi:hypothetical protein
MWEKQKFGFGLFLFLPHLIDQDKMMLAYGYEHE